MHTSSFLFCLAVIGALQASPPLDPQAVRCRVARSPDGSYNGKCVGGDTALGQLTLQSPVPAAPYLWLGTVRGERFRSAASGAAAGQSEIGVDVRPGGALRLGRAWLALSDVESDSAGLRFTFHFDVPARANEIDAEILRRARTYLGDSSRWNAADTTDMDAAPTQGFKCQPTVARSMFCALYVSSVDVAGEYVHFRPAIDAVRQALTAASRKSYRHPLVDFNNDPTRTLGDVQAVLDAALTMILKEQVKRGS